ncbi:SLC13 family permease [bacterium]|nr:SLC13 family permease [bacterium]
MTWQIALTLLLVFGAVVALMRSRMGPDLVLMGTLTFLLLAGVVDVDRALYGFSNQGLVTVAVLFVVAEGLNQTGAINRLVQSVLGQPRSAFVGLFRLIFPAAFMSAFVNNTPVVAMLMPVVNDWSKKCGLSVSKFLLPLSFATILGGMCTVFGTSTTLILNGWFAQALENGPYASLSASPLGLFEIAWIGIPLTVVGLIYLLFVTPWILPDRVSAETQFDDPREYTTEMIVEAGSPLVGKSIEEAGLRSLPGLYLMEINRDSELITAVAPERKILAHDRLIFVGVVESIKDLQRIPGLNPATNQVFKLDSPRSQRCLIEAVVSNTCPVVHQTIRDMHFRTRYNAVVIAVSRNGHRIRGKIGDIVLLPGDTLLLEAHPSFADLHRNSRDFFLVSRVADSTPLRHEQAWMAQVILGVMILTATVLNFGMLKAALFAAALMILTRCVRPSEARRSIDWSILVTIGAGIGLGEAMDQSGTAKLLAENMIDLAGASPIAVLATVYGVTMLMTNLITAKAGGMLIFPIALESAANLGVSPEPFAVAVMISAAASLATPHGFQTNLMVYGPGGYHSSDFFRVGGPLSLILWAVSVALIPLIWPFTVVG